MSDALPNSDVIETVVDVLATHGATQLARDMTQALRLGNFLEGKR
jgi:hypothetical protein